MPRKVIRDARRKARQMRENNGKDEPNKDISVALIGDDVVHQNLVKWKTTQVTIQAGSGFEVPVSVPHDRGCTVNWGFQTENGDIAFGVLLEKQDGTVVDILSKERYASDENPVQGHVIIDEVGSVLLQWDNTYSWFNSKQLVYSITLDEDDSVGAAPVDTAATTNVIFVLGGPGAGKGTQCELIAKEYNFKHLSAGDLLRAERADPNSKNGKLIDEYIKEGKIVPISITVQLLLQAMKNSPSEVYLIDGFPRNKDNIDGWNAEVGDTVNVLGVFYYDCPEDVMTTRLLKRGESSGRTDDNLESIKKRFDTYLQSTMPIIEHFDAKGMTWKIKADRPVDEVWADTKSFIDTKVYETIEDAPTTTTTTTATTSRREPTSTKEVTLAPPSSSSISTIIQPKTLPVKIILGTMTLPSNEEQSYRMLELFTGSPAVVAHPTGNGKCELDTARMYGKGNIESLLGKLFNSAKGVQQGIGEQFYVATKVNAFPHFDKSLRPESVMSQTKASLGALQAGSVDLLYLHAPDINTPILQTLGAVQTLYEQGKFRELGLSNFTAWETVHIYHLCKERGWIVPTVYQGMYNAITRDVEKELFPALRACNMRFYAYNPLAGGLLTGRYTDISQLPKEGRFGAKSTSTMYRDRFWKQSYFTALNHVLNICNTCGITMAEASIRWVMHHSMLQGGLNDGLIIGASKVFQLTDNLEYAANGALPQLVVDAFDEAWKTCKADCPPYFR